MEIVSNLAFPDGMYIPWERLLRVCLIILLSGMLYLGVQKHMESFEEGPRRDIVDAAEIKSEESILRMVPIDFRKDAREITGIFPEEDIESSGFLIKAPEAFRTDITNPDNSELRMVKVVAGGAEITAEDSEAGKFEAAAPIIEGTEIATEDSGADKIEAAAPIIGEAEATVTDSEDIGAGVEAPGIPNTGESDMTAEDSDYSGDGTVNGSTDVSETETDPDIHETTILSGFVLDAEGYITGIESSVDVTDGILVFPMDSSCVGIRKGALSGLGEYVYELSIPANICDIEPGAFAEFTSLLYVEVAENNPCYYSIDGILYSVTGGEI